jgi:predicted HD phosphohydrolase
MQTPSGARAKFRALEQATSEDWQIILRAEAADRRTHSTGDRLLKLLAAMQNDDALGSPVNLYEHSLQTATRALRAGEDDELIVVALFHDLGEPLSDNHHGLLAAELLAPWISPRRTWLLVHHVEFQRVHFANHPAQDAEARDQYIGHPFFAETAHFCKFYDQNSFDPDFPSLPLQQFVPIVRRFFARPCPPAQPLPARA